MPSLPTYGAPLPDQPPPPGRFGSPQRTLLGCGGMATVFLLLLLVVAACSETTPAKPLPAPTVTATVTVTAQPTPALRAMPQIVGSTYADAAKQIEVLGGGSLQRRSVYTDVVLPADTGAWLVCIQGPAPGEGITNGGQRVALAAPDATCPEGEGTRLHPEPRPTPTPPPAPAPAPPTGDGKGSSSGGSSSGGTPSGGGSTSGGASGGGTSGGGGRSGIQFGQSCSPVGASATTSDGRPAKCFMGRDGHARWGYRN
ncbi:hypothetical protein [Streptomyces sp. NBC_01244]|uniref:hypothetical protein n=1 Tax=Streptomyces sp. NBC_01244 TaxID=2903797 RepID=UPI002E168326|nr:hypothetical protein OG247_33015 [Streptomyces sp. NBC_01244]